MITRIVSMSSFFLQSTPMTSHECNLTGLVGLEPTGTSTKCSSNDMLKVGDDSLAHLSQRNKTSGRNDEKMVAVNLTLFSSSRMPL